MWSQGSFERDVEDALRSLTYAQSRAFWVKLLTLGLFDGSAKVREAEEHLSTSRTQLEEYDRLRGQAKELDDDLLATVQLEGVRVSRNVFSDLPAIGHADYPPDWVSLRQQVLDRDGYSCTEEDGRCDGPLQIHHIQHLSKGGDNALRNLTTVCLFHHATKHPHMMAKYYGSVRS